MQCVLHRQACVVGRNVQVCSLEPEAGPGWNAHGRPGLPSEQSKWSGKCVQDRRRHKLSHDSSVVGVAFESARAYGLRCWRVGLFELFFLAKPSFGTARMDHVDPNVAFRGLGEVVSPRLWLRIAVPARIIHGEVCQQNIHGPRLPMDLSLLTTMHLLYPGMREPEQTGAVGPVCQFPLAWALCASRAWHTGCPRALEGLFARC